MTDDAAARFAAIVGRGGTIVMHPKTAGLMAPILRDAGLSDVRIVCSEACKEGDVIAVDAQQPSYSFKPF